MRGLRASALIFGLAIGGCAAQQPANRVADGRVCISNFTIDGGFWTGKQYKTYQEFPRVSKSNALEALAAAITTGGYQIHTTNKELGIISASQGVISGKGASVPVNAVVKELPSGGVRVEVVASLTGGMITSTDAVQREFCNFLDAVNQAQAAAVPTPQAAPVAAKKHKATPAAKK